MTCWAWVPAVVRAVARVRHRPRPVRKLAHGASIAAPRTAGRWVAYACGRAAVILPLGIVGTLPGDVRRTSAFDVSRTIYPGSGPGRSTGHSTGDFTRSGARRSDPGPTQDAALLLLHLPLAPFGGLDFAPGDIPLAMLDLPGTPLDVPEPGTLALLAVAAFLATLARRLTWPG